MVKASSIFKAALFFASVAMVVPTAFVAWSAPSRAAGGGGNTTLCEATASRNTTGDKIGAGEKIKTGQKPPFFVFSSSAASGTVNFSNSSVELDRIQVPRPACQFSKYLVNLEADCGLAATHPVQVKFNCSDAGQDLYNLDVQADADALTVPNQIQNLYSAIRQVLGLTDPSFDLAACNAVDTKPEQLACAAAICNSIKDQLVNGNTKALSTAADIGQLVGSMQTSLDRCFASSSAVQFQGPGAACTADEVAATTAFDVLLFAPEEHIQVNSDGAGSYLLNILAGSTIFSPGDFMSIDMNTCTADFLIQ